MGGAVIAILKKNHRNGKVPVTGQDATVTGLEHNGDRVAAVLTDTEERIACDAVVLTTELPTTYELLGRKPRRFGRLRPAPSAVVAHIGRRQSPSTNRSARS